MKSFPFYTAYDKRNDYLAACGNYLSSNIQINIKAETNDSQNQCQKSVSTDEHLDPIRNNFNFPKIYQTKH